MDIKSSTGTQDLINELKQQSAAIEQSEEDTSRISESSKVYKDANDGTEYEWNEEKRAWFPKIDEDFIAMYQMSYGFNPETDKEKNNEVKTMGETTGAQSTQDTTKPAEAETDSTTGQKRRSKDPPAWFEMDQSKNTNIYISGLPTNITEDEFIELLSKYGIIMEDTDTRKPKVKLYRDKEGNIKGDGRCCYLKIESVELAIKLLDDSDYKGNKIKVEKAHFEMKGQFDASLKPKRKKKKKNKKGKGQEKLLDWVDREEKSSKLDRIVIIKNMFSPKDFEDDPTILLDLKNDIRKECEKYGAVKKVIVFDRHEDGVVSVGFSEVEPSETCLNAMNGRWFAGRKLLAQRWDGVTNYNMEETEEEKQARLEKWDKFLDKTDTDNQQ